MTAWNDGVSASDMLDSLKRSSIPGAAAMTPLFETITDLQRGAESLRVRRYGVIEAQDGEFRKIRLRPFPKLASVPEVNVWGEWFHRHWPGDCCRLYYNQPRRFSNFLVIKYFVSTRHTTLATIRQVLDVFDEVARAKRVDALLCDVSNWRISTAIMARFGWEPHCPSRWHRHFIRRLYGEYPPEAGWILRQHDLVLDEVGVGA
jgi:hypothetical protein